MSDKHSHGQKDSRHLDLALVLLVVYMTAEMIGGLLGRERLDVNGSRRVRPSGPQPIPQ